MTIAAALETLTAAGLAHVATKTTGMGHKVAGQRLATVVEKVAAGALTITGVRQCESMGTL